MKTPLKAALAFTAALPLVVLPLMPASAQVDGIQRIEFKSIRAGDVVVNSKTFQVEVESTSSGMINAITVTIKKGNSNEVVKAYEGHRYDSGFGGTSTAAKIETISEIWDTNALGALNGVYDIIVVVEGSKVMGTGINDESATLEDVKVNNPPATPRGVAVSEPKQGDQKLAVSWIKNSEPDITGYRVLRSVAGAGAVEAAFQPAASTSFQDGGLPFEKTIKYQVVAYRSSPVTEGRGIASPAATTETVSIPKPPPPPSPTPGTQAAAAAKKAGPLDRLGTASSPSDILRPLGIDGRPEPTGVTGGVGFNSRLPFDESIPSGFQDEQTFTEKAGELLTNPGKAIGEQLRINPVRFIAAGILLLVAAGHLAGAARRLLITDPTEVSTPQPGDPIPA